jgi:hypothetical protein
MAYLWRLLRGNIRLVVLAAIASCGFLFTEFWRNEVEGKLGDLRQLIDATGATLQRLAAHELQRDIGRMVILPKTAVEMADEVSAIAGAAAEIKPETVMSAKLAAQERLQRISTLYANDADLRSIEMQSLAQQIGSSSVRPRHMKPIELPPSRYQPETSAQCVKAYWPVAPQEVGDALEGFRPGAPPTSPETLREQFSFVLAEGQKVYETITKFTDAAASAVAALDARIDPKDPRPVMALQVAGATGGAMIHAMCVDVAVRSHSAQLSIFLRNYHTALQEETKPLTEQMALLRYVSYLIAIIAFFASNLKPAAPHAKSAEADSLAAAGAEKLAIPHDAAAAQHRADRPAGDGNPVIGRPADA